MCIRDSLHHARYDLLAERGHDHGVQADGVHPVSYTHLDVYKRQAKHGATQCGFCIPGMVVSAKGLVDAKPEPTRDEVKFAIRTNICRCTGYQQIEDCLLYTS